MNGLLLVAVLLGCLIAGAEAKAPGVTAETVRAIDSVIVACDMHLKQDLEAALEHFHNW